MGQQRPGDAPDLLPPPPEGGAQRCPAVRRGSPPHHVRAVGRPVAGPGRGHRHRAGECDGSRDHRRGPRERGVHRAGHQRVRGVQGGGGAVDPRARRAGHRRARGGDPGDRPRLRDRRAGDDLLDPGHHRAPQRRRQRPGADQPLAAVRARGPVGQRPQPAPRPEQRPGRRRHGRPPGSAAGFPARGERRAAGRLRRGLGRDDPAQARPEPARRCTTRWSAAT